LMLFMSLEDRHNPIVLWPVFDPSWQE
jgi:hypothetical protein